MIHRCTKRENPTIRHFIHLSGSNDDYAKSLSLNASPTTCNPPEIFKSTSIRRQQVCLARLPSDRNPETCWPKGPSL